MTDQTATPEAGAPTTTESGEPGASGQEPVTPANPTEAQVEQGATPATQQTGPSDEAKQQAKEDDQWRLEHPNEARTRDANPAFGGESFEYVDKTSDR